MPIRYVLLVLVMLFSFLQNLKSQSTFLGDIQSAKFPANIEQFKTEGTKAYFIGKTNQEAAKHVFITDGTEAGTKNLSQAFEVNGIFNVQHIELVGSTLFFSTNSAIYKSDGTVVGTIKVAEDFAYGISNLKAANGLLFFTADDQVNGVELWKSDGTEAGTQMVKDIKVEFSLSGNDASPSNLMTLDNKLIFAASSIEYGLELWVSDGTQAGTTLLKDINPGTSGLFRVGASTDIAILNNELYFKLQVSNGKDQLWKTDGTPSGTVLISDFAGVSTTLSGFLTFNNEVYFGLQQGSSYKLYKTDGTTGGTIEVSTNGPGPNAQLKTVGGEFYYVNNITLYKSDGTAGGTSAIKTFSNSKLLPVEGLNGKFIFVSDAIDFGGLGYELWESDGTDGGTQLIVDLFPGATSGIITSDNNSTISTLKLGSEILFYGDDGNSGETLWKTNGTAGGTQKVADINPQGISSPFTTFVDMVNVGAEVLFELQNQTVELWKTNGTLGGTTKLVNTENFEQSTLISGATKAAAIFGKTLWFIENNPSALSKVSITEDQVDGIQDGAFIGDKLIFTSGINLDIYGQEVWASDGTNGGTEILADIIPGESAPNLPKSSNPSGYTSVNNLVFFTAGEDGSNNRALWVTDGTVGGTTKLTAAGPGSRGIALGNEYFYSTGGGQEIAKLNKSDGTVGGIVAVKTFSAVHTPENFQAANDAIFFTIPSGADRGLWISDGTEAGTVKISTTITAFADVNKQGNKYYFINSSKLYETDGTLAGTKSILGTSGQVLEMVAAGGKLFFTFQATQLFRTFYVFDGDISTVVEVPGTDGLSNFEDLHVNGNKVYFRATAAGSGTELYVYEAPISPTVAVSIRYVSDNGNQVIYGVPDGYQVGEQDANTRVGDATLDDEVTSFFDFVISNSGGAELTFTSAPTFTGTNAASFEFVDFPSSIAAQSTGKFKVKYTGNDVHGIQIVTVNLFTNDPSNDTYSFEISANNRTEPSFQGYNQDFGILPASNNGELEFGSLAIGETVTKTIYVANPGYGNPLNINQVSFEGDAAGDYSVKEIRNETGIKAYLYHTIQPANALDSIKLRESFRATIVIEYAPTASGSREAIMRLDTNSPRDDSDNSKFHLNLLGSGSCVDVGSITPAGPVTICQDSGESVTLSIPAIDGAEYCWGDTGWKRVKNFGETNPSEHYLTFDNANTPIVGMRSSTAMANVYKYENDDFVQVGPADFGNIKDNSQNFKAEKNFDIATNPVNGDIYFAYSDNSNSGKITVKTFDGSVWQTVGANGFSDGLARLVNLKISPSGELYVAFRDASIFNRATVMTFDGTNWVPLEKKGFTAASALSLDLELVGEIPHLAYRDGGKPNSGATVAKFENDAWTVIGTAGFSEGSLQYIDLEVDSNNKLYVAYIDDENQEKLAIKTYDGANWVNVGSNSRLPNQISGLDLELNGTVPYLSYLKGTRAGFYEYSDGAWLEKQLLFEGFSVMSLATDNNGVLYNTSNSYVVSGVGETSFSLQKLELGTCLSTTNTLVTSDPGFYQVTVTIPGSGCVARSQNIVEVRVQECLPAIVVQGNDLEIEKGDQFPRYQDGTQFINVQANATGSSTFNIINNGLADLDLTLPLTLTGASADKFSISAQPQSATVAKEDTVSFEVQFNTPADYNTYEAIVNIANNVSGKSPYTFKVKGTATGISLSMVDSFMLDNNSDGKAGPSDVIKYTVTVDNAVGAPTYTNPGFAYSSVIPNTSLVVGSVTTSVGSVVTGNMAGETLPAIFLGDLAAGENVIITFELEVSPNLGEDVEEIIAQAQLYIDNQITNLTDDPSIGGNQDPTVTAVAPKGLSMVSATKDSDTQITVTFSDNVEMPNGSTPFANFIITDGLGTVFSASSIADVTAGDDQLIITVANTSTAVGDLILTYDTSKDEGQVSVVADNTKFLPDNFVGVVIDSDSVLPTIVSAEKNSNTEITLTFSEPVQTNATNPTDFTVTDGVSANFAVSAQADGTAKDALIVLTVTDLSGAVGDLKITYTNNNNEISDFGNNTLATDATGVSISDTWSFITTWTTTTDGESIVIPTSTLSTISIMWGDGEFDTGVNGNKSHTYSTAGTYTVSISPTITRIFMGSTDAANDAANKEKLTSVEQWGGSVWADMTGAFSGATNMVVNASGAPDLSSVTKMNNMFSNASSFNQSIDHWDVSNVTDMSGLFFSAESFNQSLNNWDVSNVTNMSAMFISATAFNGDITSWNVGKVTDMTSMFSYTDVFNQDISAWNVGAVQNMTRMFLNAKIFNQDISSWNVGSVLDMRSMFTSAGAFNQSLNGWDVSKVSNMSSMFSAASIFNGNISSWDVSAVTNMSSMFSGASAFNQDISGWNVSKVTSMQQMFNVALAFNQNIGLWDVSSVTNMVEMMRSTGAFDYDLGDWDLTSITSISGMLNGTGMSVKNYDETLIGWAAQDLTDGLTFGASGLNYCAGATARQSLIDNQGWTISDAGELCLPTMVSAVIDNNTQITLTFDQNIQTNGTNPTDFTITDAAGKTYAVSAQVDGTAGDIDIVLTVADMSAAFGALTVTYTNNNNEISDAATGASFSETDGTGVSIERPFITTWMTTSPNESITISARIGETYDYTIHWGDGGSDVNVTGNVTHAYVVAGTYEVTISGAFPRISIGQSANKLQTVEQWGSQRWTSMQVAFNAAEHLTVNATDAPDLRGVTVMDGMFSNAKAFNQDISHWDVSNVLDFSQLFNGAETFNQPLDAWDVSSATDMERMFEGAVAFNQDLNSWDVSNVLDMEDMFKGATSFNGNIGSWDVSSVTTMDEMFRDAAAFNQSLNNWDVSSVTTTDSMFEDAIAFNGDISSWDVSSVTQFGGMFEGALVFNQDISGWDVSAMISASFMFGQTNAFNQDISGWDISSLTSPAAMFKDAIAFNQDISAWNTSSFVNAFNMFQGATVFDQDLGAWDIGNLTNMTNMFSNSGMSVESYDNTLIGWAAQTVQNGVTLGAAGVNYCDGSTARQSLIDNQGWTISDAGELCLPTMVSAVIDNNTQITLTFDQNIQTNGTNPTDFTVTDAAGKTYTVSAQVDGTAGDTDIVLTVADLTAVTGKVIVTYTNNNNEIRDTSTGTLVTATDATGVIIERAFITTWETTTPNESIVIPTASGETYSYSINWGDGSSDDNQTGNASHAYAIAGSYTVSITGTFPRIHLGSSIPFAQVNKDKLLKIEQWGSIDWKSMEEAFNGASNMTIQATDAPDLGEVTSMKGMFSSATSMNQDISHWNVSTITDMGSMFSRATAFNQDLSNWNTGAVTNMWGMFSSATNFNGDIRAWDVSSVESMRTMFAGATTFNQDLNNWVTSSLTSMGSMFEGASAFNGAMGNWDMSKVTDMNAIFVTAGNFNQDISGWNTSALTNAAYMFEGAAAFNQDISGWDMSKVSSMNGMFKSATSFNQNLGDWDIRAVTGMANMLSGSGLSGANYDLALIGWGGQTVQNGVTLGAAGINYCDGATARESLINNAAWTITDDGELCNPKMASATKDSDVQITITYDQNVQTNGTNPTDFTVTDGIGLTFAVTAQADGTAGDSDIQLTVVDLSSAVGDITVTYTNNNNEISDVASGARFAATDATGITIDTDVAEPTMVSGLRDNDTQLTITFSEPLQILNADPSDFKIIDANSVNYAVTAIADGTAEDNQLVFTVDDFGAAEGPLTLTYERCGSQISDFGNNSMGDDLVGIEIALLPAVEFSTTASNGLESVNSVDLLINLDEISDDNITFDYTVAGTATGGGTDFLLADGSVTINAGDNSAKISITGIVDDFLDEADETIIVSFSNPVNAILGTNQVHTYTITDDDVAGFTKTKSTVTITEDGSSEAFDVVLDSEPTSDVVIDVASNDTGESSVSPATLTFTSANWNIAQTVTMTGENDDVQDGDIASIITLSIDANLTTDANYSGLSDQSVSVTTTDEDTAGFFKSKTSVTVTEAGSSESFTVFLGSEPTSDVVIDIASNDTGESSVSPSTLTFTSANWDTPQTVTVTGVDDDIDDGNITSTITLSVNAGSTTDANYSGLSDQSVSATTTDDDTAGFFKSKSIVTVTEAGGSETFTVFLGSEPTSNVVIDIASNDTGESSVSPATLTFTSANWDVAQTVTITGENDDVQDGAIVSTITLSINANSTSDANYSGLSDQSVSATTTDEDTAGFFKSKTSVTVTEVGSSETFTVFLGSEPTSDVVIDVTSNDAGESSVSPATLTFTSANWDTPQTVTIRGENDDVQDGDIASIITLSINANSTSDANYSSLSDQSVSATTTDDDTAGFFKSKTTVTVTEVGSSETFTVFLGSEPTSDVVIDIASNKTGESSVSQSTLTFSSANWDTPQTVTVTGENDNVQDGAIASTITLSINANLTSDASYSGLSDQSVSATTTDDDVAGFTLSKTTMALTESPTSDKFSITLNSEPVGDVVVSISSNDVSEASVSASLMTFTSSNWNVAQFVTVTGVDDDIVDTDQSVTVTISVDDNSSDDTYDPLNDQTISVTVENTTSTFVSIADVTGVEDDGTINVIATLEKAVEGGFSLNFSTVDGTAIAGSDFTALTNASINFAGTVGETQNIVLQLIDNADGELVENLKVILNSISGTTLASLIDISDDAIVTITDDDAQVVASVSVPSNGTFKIGDNLDFTVTFSNPISISGGTTSLPIIIGSTQVNAIQVRAVTNSSTVLYRYVVLEDQLDENGISVGSALNLNGSTIKDQFNVDAILSLNSIAATSAVLVDGVKPTPVISSTVGALTNTAFTATFNYDEAVEGLDVADITVTNGIASDFTSLTTGTAWSAIITPLADGPLTITLNANVTADIAGNASKAGNTLSTTYDATAPTVSSITRSEDGQLPTGTTSANFTIVFSEDVTGVDLADFEIVLTGTATGTVNTITRVDAKTHTVNVNGIGGQGTIGLNAKDDDTIIDAATNPLAGTFTGQVYSTNFIPTDILLSDVTIAENNALNAKVGALSTADTDSGDSHTYSLVAGIGDADNASFVVDGLDLKVNNTSFNYEAKTSYDIRLKTDDSNGGVFEKSLTITVTNVNEDPFALSLTNSTIEEADEAQDVGSLMSLDPDNGDTFVYTLITGLESNNNAEFDIEGSTLKTAGLINFEQGATRTILVRTTDAGGLTFDQEFTITIEEVEVEPIRNYTTNAPGAEVKNVFSPNGDGVNETWIIEDIKDNPINEVKVYAQGGKLIYSKVNYRNDWGGTFKDNPVPDGTYYYEINIYNGQKIIKGFLTIIRNR